MSTIKVDTIATRTGSGNITVSNNIAGAGTISGTNITASGTLGVTGETTLTGGAKVDTLKHTGGTTGLTIDSSGRVSTPVRPAFQCKKSSSQTSSGTFETVTWDAPVLNAGGHFSNNKFTVPLAGLYVFNCVWLSVNDSLAHDVLLAKTPSGGSSTALVRTRNATVGLHETVNLHYVGQFSVSDTVEIQIAGSGQKIYGDAGGGDNYAWTTFMGYFLG